ncbi:helix-turn-helix domain-containing protein [Candidatus Micrarchaeota archaeon]|nr:helix-turn-helix domain-containing protein [Candidatus Micrarchaeota archaeon]
MIDVVDYVSYLNLFFAVITMEKLSLDIAGEITLNESPGSSLKKWREIFGITQTELANFLKVTPSTISDYEGNRRKSPGVCVIRRFVNAIIEIDRQRGGWVTKKFKTEKVSDAYELHDFSSPMDAWEFVKRIDGKVLTNEDMMKKAKIYAFTIVDSMKAILDLPANEFIKIYGSTTERALIFTNVSMGRSPMVAIRVTELKPSIVVLHNVSELDKVAKRLSEVERVPLITTLLPVDEIKKRLTEKK